MSFPRADDLLPAPGPPPELLKDESARRRARERRGAYVMQGIREYIPPPRVEAWLNLPPGLVPLRDLEGVYDETEYDWRPSPAKDDERDVQRRFIAEFGEDAAYHWGFPVPSLMGRVMRDVFDGVADDLRRSINRQFLFGADGNTAKVPIVKK